MGGRGIQWEEGECSGRWGNKVGHWEEGDEVGDGGMKWELGE